MSISSSPYLSGYTYASLASQGICDKGDTEYMHARFRGIEPQAVEDGDILYVTGNQVLHFLNNIAHKIKNRFKLVTAQWDEGVSDAIVARLPDNLQMWYTINANITHKKITPIPLGLQNLHWRWDGNIQSDPATYDHYRSDDKEFNVLASFSVHNNWHERRTCLESARQLIPDDLIIRMFTSENRRDDGFVRKYFEVASKCRMVLCPWGAGSDTHRLWETLYLGSIPITRMCPSYRDFKDYPIIFIDSWENLSMDYLNTLYDQKLEQLKTEPRIYFDYWKKVITS